MGYILKRETVRLKRRPYVGATAAAPAPAPAAPIAPFWFLSDLLILIPIYQFRKRERDIYNYTIYAAGVCDLLSLANEK